MCVCVCVCVCIVTYPPSNFYEPCQICTKYCWKIFPNTALLGNAASNTNNIIFTVWPNQSCYDVNKKLKPTAHTEHKNARLNGLARARKTPVFINHIYLYSILTTSLNRVYDFH